MLNFWELPTTAKIGGKTYGIHSDFRDILEIFSYFQDPEVPDFLAWQIALALFYQEDIPEKDRQEAAEFFSSFVTMGREDTTAGTPLISWRQDAPLILGDINRVAGFEIRTRDNIHWWTFLSWFHGIGDGQLLPVLSIRQKLRQHRALNQQELAFYRQNRDLVEIRKPLTPQEKAQRQELLELLK